MQRSTGGQSSAAWIRMAVLTSGMCHLRAVVEPSGANVGLEARWEALLQENVGKC